MPGSLLRRTLGGARAVPIARMVVLAELATLARQHFERLEPQERRRVVELLWQGRGRPSSLSARERRELLRLLSKAEPRLFARSAAVKLGFVRR